MVYQGRSNLMVKGLNNSFMNSANVRYHIQHKQQLNTRTQKPKQQKQLRGQDLATFNNAVQELCSMYDAVNYFGKAEYAKKNGWRVINKEQLNTATIYAIRYAPVVPRRSTRQQRPQKQQQRPQQRTQPKQQQQLRPQTRQQSKQQPRQQTNKRSGKRIGGCKYRPNVPRVYSYNTKPLPTNLYPEVNNFNHLYDAFNYFGNNQVRNIKSWIESSRTHKLNSIASVFAKRNAPYVPVRQNRSNKRNQPRQQKRQQLQKRPQQKQQQQKNIPKQQSNKRQRNNGKKPQQKRLMINQQPLSNVWEEYYVSPKNRMFK
jgi:hypothetical protein